MGKFGVEKRAGMVLKLGKGEVGIRVGVREN